MWSFTRQIEMDLQRSWWSNSHRTKTCRILSNQWFIFLEIVSLAKNYDKDLKNKGCLWQSNSKRFQVTKYTYIHTYIKHTYIYKLHKDSEFLKRLRAAENMITGILGEQPECLNKWCWPKDVTVSGLGSCACDMQ